MSKCYIKIAVFFLITFVIGSFITERNDVNAEKVNSKPIRVGVSTNYPPIIFKLNEKISGVEADLAQLLAKELNRPLKFIELKWEKQIPTLMEGKTDIIMSGMSITRARRVRIDFTDHYLKSGLFAAVRLVEASKYKTTADIMQSYSNVGVVRGTTSDVFVKKNFPNVGQIMVLAEARDGAFELKRRVIDIFVHDAPSIIWLVSENEAELTAVFEPLNEEFLAWGVRRDDPEFLAQVNAILKKWKKDGTLNKVLKRWLPDLKRGD
jgi:polar amino acid transport system substrate-binding protein